MRLQGIQVNGPVGTEGKRRGLISLTDHSVPGTALSTLREFLT